MGEIVIEDMSREAEESTLLEAATKQQQVKMSQTEEIYCLQESFAKCVN
jgi:hypothetical protein